MIIPTPEELDAINRKGNSMNTEADRGQTDPATEASINLLAEMDFSNTEDVVGAVHAQLEDLTPDEALDVLKVVVANLKAEVRDFREMNS